MTDKIAIIGFGNIAKAIITPLLEKELIKPENVYCVVNSKKLKYKKIKIHSIESDQQKLINFYDKCDMFILPSFTEGHPMVLLEALSRLRPVIIFRDIEHIVGNKKGIFVSERDPENFLKILNLIKRNYNSIQQEMKQNILPKKKDFIDTFSKIVDNEILKERWPSG